MAPVNTRSGGLIKLIFLVHLILSSWGMQSLSSQIPSSYVYYNLVYMVTLLWAIGTDSLDSVIMAFLVNVSNLALDTLTLSLYWPNWVQRKERLYFGFVIANAIIRPITAILLYRIFRDRDTEGTGLRGAFADVFGSGTPSSDNRQGYQNIDTQEPARTGEAAA